MPGAQLPDDDDLDAQFDDLIGHNFPGASTRRSQPERDVPLAPPPSSRPRDDDAPLTVLDAMDRADAEAPDYVPPPVGPLRPWPLPALVGAVVMTGGIVVAVLGLLGIGMARGVGYAGASAFVVGLGVLLGYAVTRKAPPRDPGDDGARL